MMFQAQLRSVMLSVLCLLSYFQLVVNLELNLSSIESIKNVSSTIAYDMMSYYHGNLSGQIPGMLDYPPYHWWESGGMWGVLIDYWYYTNDSTYNEQVSEGLLFQTGPNWDYLPLNQTNGMGNDDQGFWAMAAMTAAEANFPNPPASGPQWLSLAQAVFNDYVSRWTFEVQQGVCGGGLRWQVYLWEDGFNYKNSISNACLFNLAARLAKYTGMVMYADWAETVWGWMLEKGLMELQTYNETQARVFGINGQGAGGYITWDGATVQSNCTDINGIPYTYNNGYFLLGAAMMFNYTNASPVWANRTYLLLNATLNAFFRNGVATELSCELNLSCDVDQLSFKAFLSRSLAATAQLAPFTAPLILPYLASSAHAAAQQCSGGPNGRMCGLQWGNFSRWDNTSGPGQQMAALEIVSANLIALREAAVQAPLSSSSGATSVGDPEAGEPMRGGGMGAGMGVQILETPTRPGRVGAAILTVLLCYGSVAFWVWICLSEEGTWVDLERERGVDGKDEESLGSEGSSEKGLEVVREELVVRCDDKELESRG